MSKPQKIILEGITGSKAYGLDTEESDEDIKGIFVWNTVDMLGLHRPAETVDHVDPDFCFHEVGKFLKLALAANPTVLETLFLENYLELSHWGQVLVDNRHSFLSQRVRNTYFGYATQQMKRLQDRGDGSFKSKLRKRYSKHARHCARLLFQGRNLLESGTLVVRVSNRDEIFAIGELEPDELLRWFEAEKDKFNNVSSALPLVPDESLIEGILIQIRRDYLGV